MALPSTLRHSIEAQPGHIHRTNPAPARRELAELGIPEDSEFAQVFLTYRVTQWSSDVSDEALIDLCDGIGSATAFVREVWGAPDDMVCLTSTEAEGCYLYEIGSERVFDFELSAREAFYAGDRPLVAGSFFQFLTWYLG